MGSAKPVVYRAQGIYCVSRLTAKPLRPNIHASLSPLNRLFENVVSDMAGSI